MSERLLNIDLTDLGATVLAVVANRVPHPMDLPDLPVPAYAVPEVPTVSAPMTVMMMRFDLPVIGALAPCDGAFSRSRTRSKDTAR